MSHGAVLNGFLDRFLVGIVLLAGFGYAIYSLGPKSLRARLSAGIAALLRRVPIAGLHGVAQRMEAAAGKSACGGCDSCGSDQATPPRPPVAEVRIPLSKIGKRH